MSMKVNLEDALTRLEGARYEDRDEKVANALMMVGMAYLQRNNFEEAFEALDEAYYLCSKLENDSGRAQVCLAQAQLAEAQASFEQALKKLDEAWEIFEAAKNLGGLVSIFEGRGRVMVKAGDYEKAIGHYAQARRFTVELGDEVGQMLFCQELAPLHRELGQFDQALGAYREVAAIAGDMGDHQRSALALVGVGAMEAALDRTKEARQALQQARELYLSLGQKNLASQVEAQIAGLAGVEE